jgi:PKD repeat protein
VQAFDWDFGDGTAHSSQQDPTHTYTIAGTFTVILTITDTAGCFNYRTYAITINAQPSAQFSYTSGCLNTPVISLTNPLPQVVSLSPAGSGTLVWLQRPMIHPVSESIWVYSTLGVYTVNLIVTSQSGCQDTTQVSVQVFGLPTAEFSYTAAPCNNGAVYFKDSSYSQQATIVSWRWEFEPGQYSTLQNPVYVFIQPIHAMMFG